MDSSVDNARSSGGGCSDRHRNARMADFACDFAMACGEMDEAQFTLI
jgi:hypothetical protein